MKTLKLKFQESKQKATKQSSALLKRWLLDVAGVLAERVDIISGTAEKHI